MVNRQIRCPLCSLKLFLRYFLQLSAGYDVFNWKVRPFQSHKDLSYRYGYSQELRQLFLSKTRSSRIQFYNPPSCCPVYKGSDKFQLMIYQRSYPNQRPGIPIILGLPNIRIRSDMLFQTECPKRVLDPMSTFSATTHMSKVIT